MAQLVKYWPHRHEDLSLLLSTHGEKLGTVVYPGILALGKWKQVDLRLADQPVAKSVIPRRVRDLFQKIKSMVPEEWQLRLASGLHMCAHITAQRQILMHAHPSTWAHKHAHTPVCTHTHTKKNLNIIIVKDSDNTENCREAVSGRLMHSKHCHFNAFLLNVKKRNAQNSIDQKEQSIICICICGDKY